MKYGVCHAMSTDRNVTLRISTGFSGGNPINRARPALKWDIPVLLGWVLVALDIQVVERANQLPARLARANDLIHEAARCRGVRIRELFAELLHLLGARGHRIGGGVELPFIQNVDG